MNKRQKKKEALRSSLYPPHVCLDNQCFNCYDYCDVRSCPYLSQRVKKEYLACVRAIRQSYESWSKEFGLSQYDEP